MYDDGKHTPLIYFEIQGTTDSEDTLLFYGHFDKQPYGTGWDKDKGPTDPVIEDGGLFGRGGADDGYAIFSMITAIKAI